MHDLDSMESSCKSERLVRVYMPHAKNYHYTSKARQ